MTLYCHRCRDAWIRVVVHELEVFIPEGEDILHFRIDLHLRQLARLTAELGRDLLEMVHIDVGVARRMHEFSRLEAAYLSDHHGQKGVGRDVERHAEEYVRTALIQLAGELSVSHIELEERMAWRKGHLLDFGHIPRGNDHPSRIRVVADHVHYIRELVDRASVRSRPAAPLMTVDRAEVAVFVRPFVPDGYAVVLEVLDVGIACDEPQELMDYGFEVDFLRGEEGEAFAEVEAHLIAEHALGAGTGAVRLHDAVFTDVAKEV